MKGRQYALKNATKQYRKEQLRAADLLRQIIDISPGYIQTEYAVNNLSYEGKPIGCILDIAIVPIGVQYKVGIRMMGGVHERKRQENKDDKQLQALLKDGWTVIDFIEEKMPNLWAKTRNEAIDLLAIEEIKKAIE